jgi:hypothetical protein
MKLIARSRLARAAAAGLLGLAALSSAAPALADAGELRGKYDELQERLKNNSYRRQLHIDSTESPNALKGDVYAVLDHPFETVSDSLKQPRAWCDILILPFNTKYCHAMGSSSQGAQLQVRIGRKYDQPVDQAYRINFDFRNVAASGDYFESRLGAAQGPMGTKDYRIVVSAVPIEGGKTFMHLSYAYGYGTMGRVAMSTYLNTVGADKIGFTVIGRDAGGQPQYIGGVRGAVERNAMRYYLAIDSYLDAREASQVDKRIQAWFNATERYPRQLREMDRATYVAMKRQEYERQQVALQ